MKRVRGLGLRVRCPERYFDFRKIFKYYEDPCRPLKKKGYSFTFPEVTDKPELCQIKSKKEIRERDRGKIFNCIFE